MKSKIKREKINNIVSGGIGGEPSFPLPISPSRYEIIDALNYYSVKENTQTSKDFCLSYLKKTNQSLFELVKKINHKYFNNIGFIFRLYERNFLFDDSVIEKQIEKLYEIANQKNKDIDDENEIPQIHHVKKEQNQNNILYYFDDCVDNTMNNIKFTITNLDGSIKDFKQAKEEIIILYQELLNNEENCYTPSTIKKLKPLCETFIKYIDAHLKTNVKAKQQRKRKSKPLSSHVKDAVGKRLVVFKNQYDNFLIFTASKSLFEVMDDTIINHKTRKSFKKSKKGFVDKLKESKTIPTAIALLEEFAADKMDDETNDNKKISKNFEIILAMK